MIQVCSSCGTRWNVRDKQRSWCPRCQGALLAPGQGVHAATAPPPPSHPGWSRPANGVPPKLPPGYRWIAVRPGAPPAPKPRGRHMSPTPRYQTIPRWTLGDHLGPPPQPQSTRTPVSSARVGRMLTVATVTFIVAAVIYLIRYGLLVLNRNALLHPLLANAAVLLGLLASLAALGAMIGCWVVLTRWLIDRRAAVYQHYGIPDPRPTSALWTGCLLPVANLFWAPVFVIETATLEGLYTRLRKPIIVWWLLWVLSAVVATFSVLTLLTLDWYFIGVRIGLNTTPQGVADNTVTVICGYLIAAATVLALTRVYRGFESKPVDRHAHRWIVVVDDDKVAGVDDDKVAGVDDDKVAGVDDDKVAGGPEARTDFAASVEAQGQEPAA